jgi:phospholipid-binding lipoprotein MlaA
MKIQNNFFSALHKTLSISSMLFLASCATTNNPVDPYERYNRAAFNFNRSLDTVVVRPVATLYATLIPAPFQGGIGRMFTNFYEPSRVINDILQGEGIYAVQDSARFVVNTTFGLAGFFDVAAYLGTPVRQQDFGITMARWGWKQSAFFVMPFMGVYTVRDFVAVPFNSYAFTFWPYIEPARLAWGLYGLDLIRIRSDLRPADKVIDEAFDPYLFVRDAYLQKRQHDVELQQNGRTQEVKAEPESGVEKSAEDQNAASVSKNPNSKNVKAEHREKKSTGKSLPDVLSFNLFQHSAIVNNVSYRFV